jgi:cytochrome o ubiquinol oxidase subunit 2
VQVVALDWKWLFIYPEYGIATVNELAAAGRPSGPFDHLVLGDELLLHPRARRPDLCDAGHGSKLHAVINKPGELRASRPIIAAPASRHALQASTACPRPDFDLGRPGEGEREALDRAAYLELEKPSEKVPAMPLRRSRARRCSTPIVNMCVEPGKMCMHEMMAIDAKGGLRLESARHPAADL